MALLLLHGPCLEQLLLLYVGMGMDVQVTPYIEYFANTLADGLKNLTLNSIILKFYAALF